MTKVVLYTYISPSNRKYLERIALRSDRSLSSILDEMLDYVRKEKPITFEKKVSSYEKKYKAYKARVGKK